MSDTSLTELAREHMKERYFASCKTKTKQVRNKKSKCCMCNREMESPVWENPPFYCWKCSDKHEIGME